jgi:predicted heme/steroid binding protein
LNFAASQGQAQHDSGPGLYPSANAADGFWTASLFGDVRRASATGACQPSDYKYYIGIHHNSLSPIDRQTCHGSTEMEKLMTLTELAGYDGRDGRPAYIAVNGTIYDVTSSPLWEKGFHPPDHQAGRDLTDELAKAPHVRAVVERFPVVGTLQEAAPSTGTGGGGKLVVGIIIAAVALGLAIFLAL